MTFQTSSYPWRRHQSDSAPYCDRTFVLKDFLTIWRLLTTITGPTLWAHISSVMFVIAQRVADTLRDDNLGEKKYDSCVSPKLEQFWLVP